MKWNKTKASGEKIRVGFIVQMPEIWDKLEPVFDRMNNSDDFAVTLIVIPPYDYVKKCISIEFDHNYFLEKYGELAVKGFENGEWIKLDNRFDYVFYQRPYDSYLPREFKSRNVIPYAKCCYIPCAFIGSDIFDAMNTNFGFFCNIYFAFLESEHMMEMMKKRFRLSKGLHHFELLGYPVLESFLTMRCSAESRTILWTPRWSFDKTIGNSSFIENRDLLFKLKKQYPSDQFVFRPHPLLLEELVLKELMKPEEVEEYIQQMKIESIVFDRGDTIYMAFLNADILITDFSSVILQFFLTGKPIIYCDKGIPFNDEYAKIIPGLYVAHNQSDILKFIEAIKSNNDYLKEKRREIICKDYSKYLNSTERIVDRIRSDARGTGVPLKQEGNYNTVLLSEER